MRYRTTRLLAPIGAVILVATVAVGQVSAALSVPSPLWFWDGNDNGVASGEPAMDHEGPGWTTSHLNRLNEAVAEWSTDTSFDPPVGDTAQNIFVDGRLARCLDHWVQDDGSVVLAVTCVTGEPRYTPVGGYLY